MSEDGRMEDEDAKAVVRFSDDVVAAIVGHMNVDHVADTLLICRSFGAPGAESARMIDFDSHGADFEATTAGGARSIRVSWRTPISERAEVRSEIVWLHEEAERRSAAV